MKTNLPFLQRKLRQLSSRQFSPQYGAAFGFGADALDDYYVSLPFRRSIPAILFSAVFLLAFGIPLVAMSGNFASSGDDSLFSLISFLFTLFWVIGWSTGVGVILLIFLCVSFGKESVHVADNRLIIRIGIPGIAFSATYDPAIIRRFRYEDSDIEAGRKWRGSHVVFDYGDSSVGFGSNISLSESTQIISRLKALFPRHDAPPVEVSAQLTKPDESAAAGNRQPQKVQSVPLVNVKPVRWNSLSSITLVVANLIPGFGVWIAGWDIGQIMLLFWAESAIIGYYNLCKMWKVGRWWLLFYGPFFVCHYGAFMAVHLLFIYVLFGSEMAANAELSSMQVLIDLQILWPALLGLLISHGLSYYTNFVKKNKGQGRSMAKQMQEPYRRVVIMHMTLIFGGFLTFSLGTGIAALMLLLLLKITADLRAHLSQHST